MCGSMEIPAQERAPVLGQQRPGAAATTRMDVPKVMNAFPVSTCCGQAPPPPIAALRQKQMRCDRAAHSGASSKQVENNRAKRMSARRRSRRKASLKGSFVVGMCPSLRHRHRTQDANRWLRSAQVPGEGNACGGTDGENNPDCGKVQQPAIACLA